MLGRFAIEIIKLRKVSCLLSNAVNSLISLHHYNWDAFINMHNQQ